MKELPTYQPEFDEYIRQGEPGKKERAQIWRTAIGLQQVDGLQTSEYLRETVRRNIEGEITMDEVQRLIKAYYASKTNHSPSDEEMEEADQVTSNIGKILASNTLDFSTNGFVALHRRIFTGVFKHAGHIRDYDITKKEFVLRGDTVSYLNWEDLRRALDYDIQEERQFSYKGLSSDEVIEHISKFVSDLWQIHAFSEGNTRTTAVFTIQYLRSIGFDVNYDLFAGHSWYFRNALVRANYKNAKLGIDYTPVYLERFFRNLLLGEQWELKSRYLVINPPAEYDVQPRNDSDTLSNDRQNDRQNDSQNSKQTKAVKRQQRLRELIQTDRFQSAEELAQKLNVSIVTIYRDLKVLHISWSGPSKKGHWTFEAL